MPADRQQTVVIGAGIGGLVAALELAHAGEPVTVVERASGPGGKMRTLPSRAGPVDAGPTVFTMAPVLEELFESVGERLADHLELRPLERLARHHWRGCETLDLYADTDRTRAAIAAFAGARAADEFARFDARAARLFAAFDRPVMRAPAPGPLSVARRLAPQGPRLMRDMAPFSTYARLLARSFSDPRLAQMFGRYATYVGGSPYLSPAILALIWHAEAAGVARVTGGMARVAQVLEALARARGATFLYDTPAQEIVVSDGAVSGVDLGEKGRLSAARVLFNGDPAALAEGLLGEPARRAARRRTRGQRSLSAWVWTFAASPGSQAPLLHHNVFFSDGYRAEFDALFGARRLARDPTLYLYAQDRGGNAPPGIPERFQIIMNAPADGDLCTPSEQEIARWQTTVFTRLNEAGLNLTPPDPAQALTTPAGFARLFPGTGGAIYGAHPHGLTSTFRRPTARTRLPGLYLAGGAVHPGPGVPMAALSGRHAAAAMLADRASTSASTRTAMPGGMSTGSRTTVAAASRSSAS